MNAPYEVLYFGCIGDKGHYLWHPRTGKVSVLERLKQPWGNHIDGGIFGDSPLKFAPGIVHVDKNFGWTGVAWADYSVDSRLGSHSTFLANADVDPVDLIKYAKQQWPDVFSRPNFPDLKI